MNPFPRPIARVQKGDVAFDQLVPVELRIRVALTPPPHLAEALTKVSVMAGEQGLELHVINGSQYKGKGGRVPLLTAKTSGKQGEIGEKRGKSGKIE